ncbi:MAG: MBL fold metallo-hydrolase [Betaproteobacteria bacterium]|nr:MBL fold metallo-hydrolase [Betaproteobacteria bacterium]NBX96062.1 MBL fold metallo-hydrolase [Betaproteobacteria bacterium]
MANSKEHELQYPLGEALPALGATMTVAPGVKWVRMGLPFALDHINLWLLRDRLEDAQGGLREGWAIVDCGITNDATRSAWEQVFDEHLEGLPVLRVIVTHMHPDHIGLAHWLTEKWSTPEQPCRMWISGTDWNAARMASRSTIGHGGQAAADFFGSHGLTDPQALEKVRQRSNYYGSMVPSVPDQYRRLLDGQVLTIGDHRWRCISGYGHAPEHIALYSESQQLLISGDMVLPRISTNVSVIDLEPEANPLALYLQSLDRYEALAEDALVLPSHGRPFKGLRRRIAQLREHHHERLADTMRRCAASPASAADLLSVLFRPNLDLHQTTFAMGEAVAHLHALWQRGELVRRRGADGVWRFSPVTH